MKTRDFYCWTMFGIAGGKCERRIILHAVRGIFQRLAAIAALLGQFVGVLSSSTGNEAHLTSAIMVCSE